MTTPASEIRLPVDVLRRFISEVLRSHGVRDEHAEVTSQRMIEADLRGVHSHGIVRLPPYSHRLDAGGYNLDPDVRIDRDTPTSALIDGDNALGHVVMTQAVETAVAKARDVGMAWVGAHHSNHAGAAGVYAAMAAEQDMIGIYMAVANANHMPPWGGSLPLLGTNPIAIAVPAGEEPDVVLDMATTVASGGKIRLQIARGEPLPEGWMVDHEGRPLTRPSAADDGFMMPIGGYKGYGLNVIIGLLAGVLNGAAFGHDVVDFNADFETPTNTGQAFFAMRPDLFRDLDSFKTEVDRHVRDLRAVPTMPGWEPVRLPGEGAASQQQEVAERGVPIGDGLLKRLQGLADRHQVPLDAPSTP